MQFLFDLHYSLTGVYKSTHQEWALYAEERHAKNYLNYYCLWPKKLETIYSCIFCTNTKKRNVADHTPVWVSCSFVLIFLLLNWEVFINLEHLEYVMYIYGGGDLHADLNLWSHNSNCWCSSMQAKMNKAWTLGKIPCTWFWHFTAELDLLQRYYIFIIHDNLTFLPCSPIFCSLLKFKVLLFQTHAHTG